MEELQAEGHDVRRDHLEAGKLAQSRGQALEDWLLAHARQFLPQLDLIYVPARFRVWVPHKFPGLMKALQRAYPWIARVFVAKPEASTWVDFVAIYRGGSAHFDAKTTDAKTAWTFASADRPVIKSHQHDILVRQAELGNPTFIYLRAVRNHGWDDYVIPYSADGLPFANKGSIALKKLEKWRIPHERHHWFEAVQAWDVYLELGWEGVLQD